MSLEELNQYCSKIQTKNKNWDKETIKHYLLCQKEALTSPEFWELYIWDEKNRNFKIDGRKIDYQI